MDFEMLCKFLICALCDSVYTFYFIFFSPLAVLPFCPFLSLTFVYKLECAFCVHTAKPGGTLIVMP